MSDIALKTSSNYAAYKRSLQNSKQQSRKASIETIDTVLKVPRTYENISKPDKQNQTAGKVKQVGRIIKNPAALSKINQIQPQTSTMTKPLTQKYQDQIMSKIKVSQMSGFYKQPVLHLSNDQDQLFENKNWKGGSFIHKVSSIANHYETKLDIVIGSLEARKDKIDKQIQQIRKFRSSKRDQIDQEQNPRPRDLQKKQQTPKFANSLGKSYKSVGEAKASRRTAKWSQFIINIKEHISLEQKLRNIKHDVKQEKKQKVRTILTEKHKITDLEAITLESEEYDPFYKPADVSETQLAKQLAQAYKKCEENWKKNMKNRFDGTILEQIYSALQGDTEKGAVSLKGFVRQLGIILQNEKYLRNRDLFRIYKRIWPFNRQKFINELKIRQLFK